MPELLEKLDDIAEGLYDAVANDYNDDMNSGEKWDCLSKAVDEAKTELNKIKNWR